MYNHNFYFTGLSPTSSKLPLGKLSDKINETYGSYENFKTKFKAAALGVFGSGYAWLVADYDKNLKILTTADQDTPIVQNVFPILSIDVWEHAYYLKHYNLRADYIDDWFGVVNLGLASAIYNNMM